MFEECKEGERKKKASEECREGKEGEKQSEKCREGERRGLVRENAERESRGEY